MIESEHEERGVRLRVYSTSKGRRSPIIKPYHFIMLLLNNGRSIVYSIRSLLAFNIPHNKGKPSPKNLLSYCDFYFLALPIVSCITLDGLINFEGYS